MKDTLELLKFIAGMIAMFALSALALLWGF
jgi:hypothetical protein